MYKYRVTFLVNDKPLNAWFVSPEEYKDDEAVKSRFQARAVTAVEEYLKEARSVPRNGCARCFAIWPEIILEGDAHAPLDAFEVMD